LQDILNRTFLLGKGEEWKNFSKKSQILPQHKCTRQLEREFGATDNRDIIRLSY
jgi:hypothetical protein